MKRWIRNNAPTIIYVLTMIGAVALAIGFNVYLQDRADRRVKWCLQESNMDCCKMD